MASEGLRLDLKEQDLKQRGSLKENPMPKQYSGNNSPTPLFMMTLRKLILEQFQKSRYSQGASPAKTYPTLEREMALKGVALHSGYISRKRLAKYDPDSHSLRTSQLSLQGDYLKFSLTLPRSGMMRNGIVFQLPPLVRITRGIESSLLHTEPQMWHTPNASETCPSWDKRSTGGGERNIPFPNLHAQVSMWPTPTVMDYRKDIRLKEDLTPQARKGGCYNLREEVVRRMFPTPTTQDSRIGSKNIGGSQHRKERGSVALADVILFPQMFPTPSSMPRGAHKNRERVGNSTISDTTGTRWGATLETVVGSGQLNPTWVEWLMGFPTGWTELSVSETQLYRKLRKSLRKR